MEINRNSKNNTPESKIKKSAALKKIKKTLT